MFQRKSVSLLLENTPKVFNRIRRMLEKSIAYTEFVVILDRF
jgi:hypothetical protein